MVTEKKKVKVVKKAKVQPEVAAEVKEPKYMSDIEKAMKLGVTLIKPGTHLTVYTYSDGTQKLEWDDEALLREVKEATS